MMDRTETNDELLEKGVTPEIACDLFYNGVWQKNTVSVPGEMALTIYVNGLELVTIMCTPAKLTPLVLGFLYSEGIIENVKDVASMRVCIDDSLADVKLNKSDFQLPVKRTLTSGCGGGATFSTRANPVVSNLFVTPTEVSDLMKKMLKQAELYKYSGGIHSSALTDKESLLVLAEDIGRHNTLDRIQGECLLRGISTKDKLLLSTGRLSSEMALKAAKMKTPIIVSRSSPTHRSIALSKDLGLTLIGYARADRLSVYSHPERIITG